MTHAAAAPPPFTGPPRFAGGLTDLGDDVLAWLQPNGHLGESNAGLVVGDGEALLIDTLWDLPRTRTMLEHFATRSDAPITTLVNTHADGDHAWGNQLLRDAQIVATQASADVFHDESPRALRVAGALGRRLGSRGNEFLRRLGAFDFRGIELTPPTRTFTGEHQLRVGGREVRLYEVGPAHSPGDLIVWIPDAAIVFAADVVMFGGIWPVMWAGPLSNWLAALDRIDALEPTCVVPGHGPICTLADVETMRRLITWVRDHAEAELDRGADVRTATLSLLESAERAGDGPWAGLDGVEALHITVATIDRHRRTGARLSHAERRRTIAAALRTAAIARSRRGA